MQFNDFLPIGTNLVLLTGDEGCALQHYKHKVAMGYKGTMYISEKNPDISKWGKSTDRLLDIVGVAGMMMQTKIRILSGQKFVEFCQNPDEFLKKDEIAKARARAIAKAKAKAKAEGKTEVVKAQA